MNKRYKNEKIISTFLIVNKSKGLNIQAVYPF